MTDHVASLTAIIKRLAQIELVGSNRLALDDEIANLRALVRTCENPRRQALPEGYTPGTYQPVPQTTNHAVRPQPKHLEPRVGRASRRRP